MFACLSHSYASEVLIPALINSNSVGWDGHGAAYCQTIASEKSRVNTIKNQEVGQAVQAVGCYAKIESFDQNYWNRFKKNVPKGTRHALEGEFKLKDTGSGRLSISKTTSESIYSHRLCNVQHFAKGFLQW